MIWTINELRISLIMLMFIVM